VYDNPAFTPIQKDTIWRQTQTELQFARASWLAKNDPERFRQEVGLEEGALGVVVGKIVAVESGGDAAAKNPLSSAYGLGQFTKDTWLAAIRRHRPDLAARLTANELLETRSNPQLAREMVLRHAEDNATVLVRAGHTATAGNVYLAHFAGVGGALKLLAADPAASVSSVLGDAVVRANPFLKGMNAGEVVRWAGDKMAGTAGVPLRSYADNPAYSTLTPDQVQALSADASSAIVGRANAEAAVRKNAYDQQFNALMLGIHDGQIGLGDIDAARQAGWLADYDDIKKATGAIASRDADAVTLETAHANMANPEFAFNPYDDGHRKQIDLAYDKGGGAEGLTEGDAAAVTRLRAFVDRSDIVPEAAVVALQGGVRSRDANARMAAFTVMDGLYREAPNAIARAFTDNDVKLLQEYQSLAGQYTSSELAERLDPNADPARRRLQDDLRTEGRKIAGEYSVDYIMNEGFDPSVLPLDEPAMPLDPIAQVRLQDEFAGRFAELYSVNADRDKSARLALEYLRTRWGATNAGNTGRLMFAPPENFYPQVNGSHDWLKRDLEETVQQSFPDAQAWGLVGTGETEGAMSAGNLPPYAVAVIDKDGVYRVLSQADITQDRHLPDSGRVGLVHFDYLKYRDEELERFQEQRPRVLESERLMQLTPRERAREEIEAAQPEPADMPTVEPQLATPARQGLSQSYIDMYIKLYREQLISNGTSEADTDTMTARKRAEMEARGQ
jgi:hypothetical protein